MYVARAVAFLLDQYVAWVLYASFRHIERPQLSCTLDVYRYR